ncbi:MAG: DUF5312 domain-containing protein [Treponema sp.]|nr:DUF5312 domain-containing protein [Treponema sp.]
MANNPAQVNTHSLQWLISGMSQKERIDLLTKLRSKSHISSDPLYEKGEAAEAEPLKDRYQQLPWLTRLLYYIKSIFTKKPGSKIFEEEQITNLGRQIQRAAPAIFDCSQKLLLAKFHNLASDLKESARFFFTALDSSINRDKGTFFAFLGSLVMEKVHLKLSNDTSPEALLAINSNMSESELRSLASKVMEDALKMITKDQRNAMYHNVHSLVALKELSSFPFDRFLMSFNTSRGGRLSCPVKAIDDMLYKLNDILFSLKEPPSVPLLESLFIFQLQIKTSGVDSSADRDMSNLLSKAEESITAIRNFNKKVPLTRILRFAYKELNLVPQQISGGEDWFPVYRDYWKKYIDFSITGFYRQRGQMELNGMMIKYFGGAELRLMDYAYSDNNPKGFPLPESFALNFLLNFHTLILTNESYTFLNLIQVEGMFVKIENRTEFSEAFYSLQQIEEEITKFDNSLSPSGEFGKRYAQANDSGPASQTKTRKMQLVKEEASRKAMEIMSNTVSALLSLLNVLRGIMRHDVDIKYGTIFNLDVIGGNNHDAVIKGLNKSIVAFQQALQIHGRIERSKELFK